MILSQSSVVDLLSAFKRVWKRPEEVGQILREEIPLEVKIREILDRLEEQTSVALLKNCSDPHRRIDLIVTFLALLELIRLKQVVARQADVLARFESSRA